MRSSRTKAMVILIALFVGVGPAAQPAAPPAPIPDSVRSEIRAIAKEHLQRLGETYRVHFDRDRNLLYISALDDEHLKETMKLLSGFSDAFHRMLKTSNAPWIITIVLPTAEDYRSLAANENVRGFYEPSKRTLTSIDRGRVLVHEFTHALHHADAAASKQFHPVWVCEGLATLFESCTITPSRLDPRVDARLLKLQEAIRLKRTIPLQRLLTMKHPAFISDANLCYAQARYLMLYLVRQDKLPRWYQLYKKGFSKDPSGTHALEEIFGKNISRIEKEWMEWAAKLQLPLGERASTRARLGLQLQDTSSGAEVVGMLPGSAAQRAGRIKVGDIIVAFNGHETTNAAEVVGAIQAAGAMQTVTVQLRRRGRKITVHQPLGSPKTL